MVASGGRIINNFGTLDWTGPVRISLGGCCGSLAATFNNQAGVLFNVLTDGQPINRGIINNFGTIVKSGSAGTTQFDLNGAGGVPPASPTVGS